MAKQTDEEVWADWCERFDSAYQDVLTMFHNRHVWRTVLEMLDANSDVEQNAIMANWLTRCYVTTQCAGVRRQCDERARTATLMRCLEIIASRPAVASRQLFEAAVKQRDVDQDLLPGIVASFDLFANPGGSVVDPTIVRGDMARLRRAADAVSTYTDKKLAHREHGERIEEIKVSFDEINEALDVLGETLKRYFRLRHPGQLLANVTPAIGLNWLSVFEQAWLPQDFRPPSELDLG